MSVKAGDPEWVAEPQTNTFVGWFAVGRSCEVEVNGVRVTVRFVGRNGRRGRIAIEAPAGIVFRAGGGR